jgi:hypothetical protein
VLVLKNVLAQLSARRCAGTIRQMHLPVISATALVTFIRVLFCIALALLYCNYYGDAVLERFDKDSYRLEVLLDCF